jgi:hypothetical protein
MEPPRLLASVPAVFNAAIVPSTVVKITVTFRRGAMGACRWGSRVAGAKVMPPRFMPFATSLAVIFTFFPAFQTQFRKEYRRKS